MAQTPNYQAIIKVVGVGGGGVNALNRMIQSGLRGVEFVAVNTDAQALLMSDADVKLDIGSRVHRSPPWLEHRPLPGASLSTLFSRSSSSDLPWNPRTT